MKRQIIKTISLILLLVFFTDTCCYGLAPQSSSKNPIDRREILAVLQRTQIRYAESEDALKLLNVNNAECLLLSSGKYLVTKEVAQDDLRLLRAIIHEDIEAIMQIIAKEDRYRHQGIKELILKYFPPDEDNKLPIELYVNHTVAIAFEWLILIEQGLILRNEVPEDVEGFLTTIEPIIKANKHNYFTAEFWDSGQRGRKIKSAVNAGMRFYQVTSSVSDRLVFSSAPLDQHRTDTASLKNYPKFFVYGPTFVMGCSFSGEDGGDDYVGKAKMITDVLKDVLGNRIVCYDPHNMHVTIGAIRGGDYSRPNQPIDSLGPADIGEMLKIISETKMYKIKLREIRITSQGEVLIFGSAYDAESRKTLSEFRRRLKEEARFGIREHDMDDRCHIAIGSLMDPPTLEEIEQINKRLTALVTQWKKTGDHFAVINISKVKLVHYAHRSLRDIAAECVFDLGKRTTVSAEEIRRALIDNAKSKQGDLHRALDDWLKDKMSLYAGDEPEKRKLELVSVAKELIFGKDGFVPLNRFMKIFLQSAGMPGSESISIYFPNEMREEGTNDFTIGLPDNLSEIYKEILAEYIAAKILNAMLNNGGTRSIIVCPEGWEEIIDRNLKKHKLYERIQDTLETYYGKNSFNIQYTHNTPSPKSLRKEPQFIQRQRNPSILYQTRRGVYIGVDIGGSSVKFAAVVDGKEIPLGRIAESVYKKKNAEEYIDLVKRAIMAARDKLSEISGVTRIDGIGIAVNAAIKDGKIVHAKYVREILGDAGTKEVSDLARHIKDWAGEVFGSGIQVVIGNDGHMGAFQAAYSQKSVNTAYLGLGSSVAFGYINQEGKNAAGLCEIHFSRIDLSDGGAGAEDGIPGTLGRYLSIRGVVREGKKLKIVNDTISEMSFEEAGYIVSQAEAGDEVMLRIAKIMGRYLVEAVVNVYSNWPVEHLIIGGGLSTGKFGEAILEEAKALLMKEFPEIKVSLALYKGDNSYVSSLGAAHYASSIDFEEREKRKIEKALAQRYEAFLFDVDGTLTESKGIVPSRIIKRLVDLLCIGAYVGIVSGRCLYPGDSSEKRGLMQICKDIIDEIKRRNLFQDTSILKRLYFFPEDGTCAVNGANLSELEDIIGEPIFDIAKQKDIYKIIKKGRFKEYICGASFRGKGYSFSVKLVRGLGEEIKREIKKELRTILDRYPEFQGKYDMHTAYATIDVVLKGADKVRAIQYLKQKHGIMSERIASVGDRGERGGNDFRLTNRKGGFSVYAAAEGDMEQVNVPAAIGLKLIKASEYLLDQFYYVHTAQPKRQEFEAALEVYIKRHESELKATSETNRESGKNKVLTLLFSQSKDEFIKTIRGFVLEQRRIINKKANNLPRGLEIARLISGLHIFAVTMAYEYYVARNDFRAWIDKVGFFCYGGHSRGWAISGSDFDFAFYSDDSVPAEIASNLYGFLRDMISGLGFGKVSPRIQTFIKRGLQEKSLASIMDRVRFSELTFFAGSPRIGFEIEKAKRELKADALEQLFFNFACLRFSRAGKGDITDIKRSEGTLRDISRLIWLGQIYWLITRKEFIQNPFENKEIFTDSTLSKINDALNFFLMLRNACNEYGIASDSLDAKGFERLAQSIGWASGTSGLMSDYKRHARNIAQIKKRLRNRVFMEIENSMLLPDLGEIYDWKKDVFNNGLMSDRYIELLDKSPIYRYLIALNVTDGDVLSYISQRAEWFVRYALGRNPHTPQEVLQRLVDDKTYEERDVRLMVARNKNTGVRILKTLLYDEAEVVRKSAAKTLEDKLVAEMSEEEKLLMLLWPNTPKSLDLPEHRRVREKFGEDLFQVCEREMQSPADIVKHMNSIIENLGLPLLFTINQEGGRLNEFNKFHTVTSGNMALGAICDVNTAATLTYRIAAVIAKELKASGVTWDFAPDADMLYSYLNRDVGTRSFGCDPQKVPILVAAFVRGLQDNGVIATVKHFPTYGRCDKDAHVGCSRIKVTEDDIAPYMAAIKAGAESIMLGHVIVENWDPDRPVTVSPEAIKRLRNELGFNGLIVTDGLTMAALEDYYSGIGKDPDDAAVDAFNAGADIMLFVQDFTHRREAKEQQDANDRKMVAYRKLRERVRSSAQQLSEARINESFRKLIRIIIKYGIGELIRSEDLNGVLRTEEAKGIMQEIGDKSVTLIKNEDQTLPIDPASGDKMLVLSIKPPMSALTDKTWHAEFSIYDEIKARSPGATNFPIDLTFNKTTKTGPDMERIMEDTLSRCEGFDTIVIQTYNAFLPDLGEKKKHQAELVREIIKRFKGKKRVIVVSMGAPYDILEFSDADAYIATYNTSEESLRSAAKVIFGEMEPIGKLPVAIPGFYEIGHGLSLWDYPALRDEYMRTYQLDQKIYTLPQSYGSHAEGPVLDSHIECMLERLRKLISGEDTNVPEELRLLAVQYIRLLRDSIFLHDVGKIRNMEIEVDGKVLTEDEYKEMPEEVKRDPAKTIIKYKGHEEAACEILKDKISPELAMVIRVHGLNDIFRKKHDDENSLRDAYESVYGAAEGNETLLKLAFIVMYLDTAATFKVRVKNETPYTEEAVFYKGFLNAERLFKESFPLIGIKDRFIENPNSQEMYRHRFLARRVYDMYAALAGALGFPYLEKDLISKTAPYIDNVPSEYALSLMDSLKLLKEKAMVLDLLPQEEIAAFEEEMMIILFPLSEYLKSRSINIPEIFTEIQNIIEAYNRFKGREIGYKRKFDNLIRRFKDAKEAEVAIRRRLAALTALKSKPKDEFSRSIIAEANQVYVPLAYMLGFGSLASRIREMCFSLAFPGLSLGIEEAFAEYYGNPKNIASDVLNRIKKAIERCNTLDLKWRLKGSLSIYVRLAKKYGLHILPNKVNDKKAVKEFVLKLLKNGADIASDYIGFRIVVPWDRHGEINESLVGSGFVLKNKKVYKGMINYYYYLPGEDVSAPSCRNKVFEVLVVDAENELFSEAVYGYYKLRGFGVSESSFNTAEEGLLRNSRDENELRENLLLVMKRRFLVKNLAYVSSEVRKWIYKILKEAKSGHLGGPLSSVELLTVLYFGGVLRYDPDNPKHPGRDRVLMRGHMGPVHYPILSMAGFFPQERLYTYRKYNTLLPGHEDHRLVPGVDITPSGSLGMLLSYGTGSAHIAKTEGKSYKVYVFLGDGEEQEGNVAEAARNASHLKLDNLVCIIDKNLKQLTFPTEEVESAIDLRKIWEGYGWNVIEIKDGHDIGEILTIYNNAYCKDKPTLIIANTVKGKGVPGIEKHETGVHSGRELEGFGYSWDDMLKIEQVGQDKIGKYDYKKFIRDAVSRARLSLMSSKIQSTPTSVDVPKININVKQKNYDNMVKALQDYFEMLQAWLEGSGNPFKVHSLSADFLPSFRVKPETLSRLGSYIDVGLKEQHMVAMAHGISVTDPNSRVVVMTGDEFLYRSADQIHVCAQGNSRVIFITCDAGICGAFNGPTHQSSGQPGMIATMSGITMFEPADVYDLYDCLNWALTESKGPVYIRTHIVPIPPIERKEGYDAIRGYNVVFEPPVKDSLDVIVVASGFPVGSAIEAGKILYEMEGMKVRVISVTNPKALDEGFVRLLENDIPVLTVYNGNPAVLESFVAKAVLENPVRKPSLIRGHGFDYGLSGSIPDLMKHFKMDGEGLSGVIKDIRHSASGTTSIITSFDDGVKKAEGLTLQVVKTFTRLRISGLDRIEKRLARMIGAVAKQVSSVDRIAGRLVKAEEEKYILVDEERIKELREAMGGKNYKKIEEDLERNNYFITTELPDGVDLKDVIRLVDPIDLERVERVCTRYLPMPYTRSSLYMSALVLQAGGDVKSVDALVKGFIGDLYSQILNRDVTEDDLIMLFTRPWEFLPQIKSAIADLDNLRKAIVLIEKAA